MARTTIADGDTGAVARAAINDNFEELYPASLNSFVYNADNNVTTITRADGWTWTYGWSNGRLSSITKSKTGQPTQTMTVNRDGQNRVTSAPIT